MVPAQARPHRPTTLTRGAVCAGRTAPVSRAQDDLQGEAPVGAQPARLPVGSGARTEGERHCLEAPGGRGEERGTAHWMPWYQLPSRQMHAGFSKSRNRERDTRLSNESSPTPDTCGTRTFPSQGLNPGFGCDLRPSCGGPGSLTHCAGPGIEPGPPQRPRLLWADSEPTAPQQELPNPLILELKEQMETEDAN